MASLHGSMISIPLFTFLVLVFLTSFPSPALSQVSAGDAPLPSPTAAECGTRLLQLAPPVEGSILLSEAKSWCKSVERLQQEQPRCLCILLNDPTFNSFLLNSAVALKLPLLCDLKFDLSTCSGVSSGVSGLYSSDQDSSETKALFDITELSAYPSEAYPPEYPSISVAPAAGMISGSDLQMSNAVEMKIEGHLVLAVVVSVAAFLLKKASE